MSLSKYEQSKVYFEERYDMYLPKDLILIKTSSSKNEKFSLVQITSFQIEETKLKFELSHEVGDDNMRLSIYKFENYHNRSKLDGIIKIQNMNDGKNSIIKRILVQDVGECTTFDCTNCIDQKNNPQLCNMCYTDNHFCSFEKFIDILGDQTSEPKCFMISMACCLHNYGNYNINKIIFPISSTINHNTLTRESQFSDFKLISRNGKEFNVHRIILASKSEVFYKVFNEHKEAKNPGILRIDSLDGNMVKLLLDFIYKGELGDEMVTNVTLLLELLQHGYRYIIPSLIEYCIHMIWLLPDQYITLESVVEIFIQSQLLKIRLFQEKAIKILKKQEPMKIVDLFEFFLLEFQGNPIYIKYIKMLFALMLSSSRVVAGV